MAMSDITPASFSGEFEITRMTPAQRPETIAVCNAAFGFGPGKDMDFGRDWPYLWNDDRADNMWLCLAGDKIVGAAGCYPVPVRLGGVPFQAACVGQVATLPAWRGRGVFTRVMDAICAHADVTTDFTWLGGDRLRYGRWGWATGGRRHVFEISQRMLGSHAEADETMPVRPVEAADMPRIYEQIATHGDGIDYTLQEFTQLVLQCARGVVCNDSWALCRSYGTLRIMEAHGELTDLVAIAARLSRQQVEGGDLDGVISVECSDNHDLLMSLARHHYRTGHADPVGMFRVSNLHDCVSKIAQIAGTTCPGGSDELSIENTDTGEAVRIVCTDGEFTVTEGAGQAPWRADRLAISEALFGLVTPEALGVPLAANSPIRALLGRGCYLPFALYAM
jgi:GNAT superfamily N-acetyltransferase